MELTSEKSCCSAGNNQVDGQAGITSLTLLSDSTELKAYLISGVLGGTLLRPYKTEKESLRKV